MDSIVRCPARFTADKGRTVSLAWSNGLVDSAGFRNVESGRQVREIPTNVERQR